MLASARLKLPSLHINFFDNCVQVCEYVAPVSLYPLTEPPSGVLPGDRHAKFAHGCPCWANVDGDVELSKNIIHSHNRPRRMVAINNLDQYLRMCFFIF